MPLTRVEGAVAPGRDVGLAMGVVAPADGLAGAEQGAGVLAAGAHEHGAVGSGGREGEGEVAETPGLGRVQLAQVHFHRAHVVPDATHAAGADVVEIAVEGGLPDAQLDAEDKGVGVLVVA